MNIRRFLRNGLIFVPVFVFIAIIFTSCYVSSQGGCDGYVKVLNSIPDTTMVVGQTIKIDLSSNPVVFQQSVGNNEFSYNVLNQDWLIVDVEIRDFESLLTLRAESAGVDTISIQAQDDCETFAKTTFVVTVIDTSAH